MLLAGLKKLVLVQLLFFYIFVGIGLTVNLLQLLTYVLVRPFSVLAYRRLNRALACSFWSYVIALAQYWSGCECEIFMPDDEFKFVNREHCIVICNHKYDVDWLMGWIVCQRTGLLPVLYTTYTTHFIFMAFIKLEIPQHILIYINFCI